MSADSLEEIRKKNLTDRVAAGACPECFWFEHEWKNVTSYVLPSCIYVGRQIGNCELCGAPQYQEIL
jgi:hypothetical protein